MLTDAPASPLFDRKPRSKGGCWQFAGPGGVELRPQARKKHIWHRPPPAALGGSSAGGAASVVGFWADALALGGARLEFAVAEAVGFWRAGGGGGDEGRGGEGERFRELGTREGRGSFSAWAGAAAEGCGCLGRGFSKPAKASPRRQARPLWARPRPPHSLPPSHPSCSWTRGRGSPCRPPKSASLARTGWPRASPGACRTPRTCLTPPARRCSSRTPGRTVCAGGRGGRMLDIHTSNGQTAGD